MYWQTEVLREGVAMTVGDTYRLDLPEHGLLGSLLLRIGGTHATGYGQDEQDWRLIDVLTKFEVKLDGADILKSLTGYQVQAAAYWDQGIMPPSTWRAYATNYEFCYLLINFGRKLKDRDLGLNLGKYNQVEFLVTNDADATQFSAMDITVVGMFLRDVDDRQFRGHMRTEEWRTWVTVANETKYNELPVSHPIRRIMLQAMPDLDANHLEETNFANLMYDVELSLKTGQTRLYKGGIDDIARMNLYERGSYAQMGAYAYQLADDGIQMSMGYVLGFVAGAAVQDGAVATTFPTTEAMLTSGTQKLEDYEGDRPVAVYAHGLAPFHTALFNFDDDPDPATWLDPERNKTVKLDILTRNAASAADGRNAIVLDRLVLVP